MWFVSLPVNVGQITGGRAPRFPGAALSYWFS